MAHEIPPDRALVDVLRRTGVEGQRKTVKVEVDRAMLDRIDSDFRYHRPTGDQALIYEDIRADARYLAKLILASTPPSREQSLALTHLEEAVMWANAAIARHDTDVNPA